MFSIVSGGDSLVLSREDARDLELKLNVSYYGHEWSAIGTALFDFHSKNVEGYLEVVPEQLTFLKKLQEIRGWESCKNFGAPKK